MLAIVAKIVGTMRWAEMRKAQKAILGFALIVAGLIAITRIAGGKKMKGVAATLIGAAGAIAVLGIIATLLGRVDEDELKKGLLAITLITVLVAILIAASAKANKAGKAKDAFMGLAAVIGVIGLVIAVLSFIPAEKMIAPIVAIGVVLAGLALVIAQLGKIKNSKNAMGQMIVLAGIIAVLGGVLITLSCLPLGGVIAAAASMSAVLLALAASLLIISKAGKIKQTLPILITMGAIFAVLGGVLIGLSTMPWQQSLAAAGAMSLVMLALAASMKIMGDSKKNKNSVPIMLSMAAVIGVLGGVLTLLAMQPWAQALAAAASMSVVLLALAGAMTIIGNSKKNKNSVPIMLTMALVIGVLGGVLALIAMMPWQQSLAAAGAMSLVLLALSASMLIIGNAKKIKQTIPILLTMAGVVAILGVVLGVLGMLPINNAIVAAVALSAVILVLSVSIAILSNIKSIPATVIATLLILAAAVAVIGTVMSTLGGMGGTAVITSLVALAGALVILAIGLNLMNGTIAGSAALLIASVALIALASAMTTLGALSWDAVLKGLVTLAGTLLILGIAGLVLGPVVPVILALAAAIAIIGAAVLLMGAGISLIGPGLMTMATGFAALSQSMSANMPLMVSALTLLVTGIAALIPVVVKAIGDGIIEVINTITRAAPALAQAVVSVITAILSAIVQLIPVMVKAGADMVVGFLNGIAQQLPRIIQAAFDLVLAFINGLADGITNNAGKVTAAVKRLLSAMINAITGVFGNILKVGGDLVGKLGSGISGAVGKALSAVGNLLSKIVNGIKAGISKFVQVGKDLVNGLIKGIANIVPAAIQAVKNLGSSVLNAICKVLGIASPSKEFAAIGEFADLGFIEGLVGGSGDVNAAAAGVGTGALDAFKGVFAGQSGSIDLMSMLGGSSDMTTLTENLGLGDILGLKSEEPEVIEVEFEANEDSIKEIQQALVNMGYDVGKHGVDGILGPDTIAAIEAYQRDHGLAVTGIADASLVDSMKSGLLQLYSVQEGLANLGYNLGDELANGIYGPKTIAAIHALQEAMGIDAESTDGKADNHTMSMIENRYRELENLGKYLQSQGYDLGDEVANKVFGDKYKQALDDFCSSLGLTIGEYETFLDLLNSSDGSKILDQAFEHVNGQTRQEWNAIKKAEYDAKEYARQVSDEEALYAESLARDAVDAAAISKLTSLVYDTVVDTLQANGHKYMNWESHRQEVTQAIMDSLSGEERKLYLAAYESGMWITGGYQDALIDELPLSVRYMLGFAQELSAAFREENQINSPSKLYFGYGKYIVQGLINGIRTYSDSVPTVITKMANLASESMNDIIAHIAELFNGDMDVQPTIAPVLDLSNVRSGISTMNGLLGNSTMAAFANAGGISSMMNSRGQNGVNDDIVSELSKLRADLSNMEKNVYNVNGVTYDDGSNISEAVKTIVRAARIERRI